MNPWDDQPNYTVKAAAKRVRRDTRTIQRWIRAGLQCRNVAGNIIIDHEPLMEFFKAQILNNPNRKTRRDI